mgnify:CR=1 FL=1
MISVKLTFSDGVGTLNPHVSSVGFGSFSFQVRLIPESSHFKKMFSILLAIFCQISPTGIAISSTPTSVESIRFFWLVFLTCATGDGHIVYDDYMTSMAQRLLLVNVRTISSPVLGGAHSWGFTVRSGLHDLVVAPSACPQAAWLRIPRH